MANARPEGVRRFSQARHDAPFFDLLLNHGDLHSKLMGMTGIRLKRDSRTKAQKQADQEVYDLVEKGKFFAKRVQRSAKKKRMPRRTPQLPEK
ncbi:MAG TPA: hypothetical protein VL860_12985 [Planctomycetota bacterium]|nr:hypothetical protein [Planctomycetota bacterium]